MNLKKDIDYIVDKSISSVLPDKAVKNALNGKRFGNGKLYVVAAGKAAWQMAYCAHEIIGGRIEKGIVCTKYNHVKGKIPGFNCYEGGHPLPDENSIKGTKAAIELVKELTKDDTVIFLLSGGGSSLFELPLVPLDELSKITQQLLACGAEIKEINTIRKRLSAVKGGKFAGICYPARVFSIILSDVLGDSLDMIASGPTYPDSSTSAEAMEVVKKYKINISGQAKKLLLEEPPELLCNAEYLITGSVRNLCLAAKSACEDLGYSSMILTDQVNCQAKDAGSFIAAIAKSHQQTEQSLAFIVGGETVVQVTGGGKGGRNQELALAAAYEIDGLKDTAVFSVGSDGTDGPTDAAGAFVDGNTKSVLDDHGISIPKILRDNNAYEALKASESLIFTGPTGTNVNDISVLLIRR